MSPLPDQQERADPRSRYGVLPAEISRRFARMAPQSDRRKGIGMSGTGQIDVWWARQADAAPRQVMFLDDIERTRLARFHQDADQSRYLVAHALARLAIGAMLAVPPGEIQFDRTCPRCGDAHGKPQVAADPGVQFSISHSGLWVAVAVGAEDPVGVDVEEDSGRHDPEELAPVILSEAEQSWFYAQPAERRGRDLLRYWTRKEAVLKATGDGLSVSPATLTLTTPATKPVLLSWKGRRDQTPIRLFDIDPDGGHLGSVAVLGGQPRELIEHDGSALLAG